MATTPSVSVFELVRGLRFSKKACTAVAVQEKLKYEGPPTFFYDLRFLNSCKAPALFDILERRSVRECNLVTHSMYLYSQFHPKPIFSFPISNLHLPCIALPPSLSLSPSLKAIRLPLQTVVCNRQAQNQRWQARCSILLAVVTSNHFGTT